MHGHALAVAVSVVILTLCVFALAADLNMEMNVSPKCLVLSAPTNWITIHTDMRLSCVDRPTIGALVNGESLPIALVKANARGEMVLKIEQSAVHPHISPGTATFVVTGATTGGDTFEGVDTVRVRE